MFSITKISELFFYLSTKKIRLFFVFTIPILFNFIYNIYDQKNINYIEKFNMFDLISTSLLFLFLYVVGNEIKKSLKLNSISFGIVLFIISFFIIDLHLLLFSQGLKFNSNFLLVCLFWLVILNYKNKSLYSNIYILITYTPLYIFNRVFNEKITTNTNVIGDIEAIFFQQSQNILQNSYYFSVVNYAEKGYPQFSSYIQSLFFKLSFNLDIFVYKVPTTQITYLLFLLFIFELKINNTNKFFLIYIYSLLIANSQFFQFLFTSSLMSEGIIGYLLVVICYEVSICINKNRNVALAFLSIGTLYLTKQFISTFSILFIIFVLLNKKYRKYALLGFYVPILKEVNYIINFRSITSQHHISQIDITQTFIDLLTLNNLRLNNITLILQKILLDKPFSIFLFIFLVTIFYYLFQFKQKNIQINTFLFFIFLNYMFVFLLYISAWKKMELESPIRFFLQFLNLKLLTMGLILEDLDKRNVN